MPVEDSEPNSHNTLPAGKPYGCSNGKRAGGYYIYVRDYAEDGTFVYRQEFVQDVMSKTCRYDHSITDQRCQFCNYRGQGEIYDESIRRSGT